MMTYQKPFINQPLLVGCVTLLLFFGALNTTLALDDDREGDENDLAETLGTISGVSFIIASIYILLFQLQKLLRKREFENKLVNQIKTGIKFFLTKFRKPLLITHYSAGLLGLGTIIIHGILFLRQDFSTVILGIVTTVLYLFYFLSGILTKINFPFMKKHKKLWKNLYKSHVNIIIFLGIIILHLIHLGLAD
ncbi:hypothetical protein NEF87_004409 [Candidatus Lokiarchaeum ossiferum]|uniref:Uncharacterized protein n=1 Tax=Candidatus Lokiarchaeum ossiferum TaxID=2951803 RepID=A0ABY6HZX2_9ARCH|nr:hypothetical protein NEF87_004409 [Candidatus Lokiarchaeum sp. B-35]